MIVNSLQAMWILAQIFLACLPVYIVFYWLERASIVLSRKMLSIDFLTYFDRKLAKLQEQEKQQWRNKEKELDDSSN